VRRIFHFLSSPTSFRRKKISSEHQAAFICVQAEHSLTGKLKPTNTYVLIHMKEIQSEHVVLLHCKNAAFIHLLKL
jgi:hypothetical protein